ncbi:MAG: response regulator [Anaerolineae bacterium]|nr:response regulator [Anaerolineae bacterium]
MTRVLVVDDEIETLDLFRVILEMAGYDVITVLNSTDALMMAELERPDCVLLDIMMPYLDGFTLCKIMRLHPATLGLPIIFVTAYPALDLEDRRKEAGADFVLFKPVSMDGLINGVQRALNMDPNRPLPQTGLLRGKTGILPPLPSDKPTAGRIMRPPALPKTAPLTPKPEDTRPTTGRLYPHANAATKKTAKLNPDRLNPTANADQSTAPATEERK